MIYNGEADVFLPLGTLFKDSTKNIRQRMIEEGVIEAIVNMPSGMFLTTNIPVCVWFLKKGRSQDEIEKGIYMMDASKCFEKDGKNNKFIGNEAEKAISTFILKNNIIGFSEFIPQSVIVKNSYNLSVSRYIFEDDDIENIDITKLNNDIDELYLNISELQKINNSIFKDY